MIQGSETHPTAGIGGIQFVSRYAEQGCFPQQVQQLGVILGAGGS